MIKLKNVFFRSLDQKQKEKLAREQILKYLALRGKPRKRFWHILKWCASLIVPDFLIGYPSLLDNLKIFRKHPNFRPLRMAFVAWLIFTLTIGSSGFYILLNAPQVYASGDSWLEGWQYRNKISISNTNVDADLSYFPLLVKISETGGGTANIGYNLSDTTNGYDIRFTDSDGATLLPYESESFSVASNNLTANLWVNIPTVDHDAATDIYIYYGNDSANTDWTAESGSGDCSAITQAQCVWKEGAAQDYSGVWHLKEVGAGVAGDFKDSTANLNHSVNTASQPSSTAGLIGGAESFNAAPQYITVNSSASLALTGDMTIEAWVNITDFANYNGIASKVPSNKPAPYDFYTNPTTGIPAFYRGNGTLYANKNGSTAPTTGVWQHLTVTMSDSTVAHYLNGATNGGGALSTTIADGGTAFIIGSRGDQATKMKGSIDELRVSSVARSAAWVKFVYNNINSVGNELTIAAQELVPTAPDTPTNSTPINLATHQLIIPTLEASAFSDLNEGDTQGAAQWQISTTSGNYTSPVYDSGTDAANKTSIIVPADTLEYATTYFWHVRYQDAGGLWSSYSNETSFATANIPSTPSNTSPTNGAINQDPTLTLTGSAFSSLDVGASHNATQWQVRSLTDAAYSSPIYDSSADASNLVSISVPAGNLSKNTTYYWHVRYQDDLGYWSAYSAETAFTTGVSPITVVSVGATEYQSDETAKLTVQIQSADGTPANNATAAINIFNPSNSAVVSAASMTYLSGSSGLYYYNYTVPATEGVYTYQVTATYGANTSYSSHAFHVSPALNTITTLNTNLNTVNTNLNTVSTNIGNVNSTLNTVNTNLNSVNSTLGTVNANVSSIKTTVENAASNLDILIGALIVTQSSVNDNATTSAAFVTSLTNVADDFYNNAVLTFTSGALNGQARRISDYVGASKQITVSPALSTAPANSDSFTIVKQNAYVEEQLAAHETAQSASRAKVEDIQTKTTDIQTKATDIQTKVTSIQSTVNTMNTLLQSVDGKIDTLDTDIDILATNLKTIDNNVDAIVLNWGTSSAADIISDVAGVKTVVDNIRTSQQLGYTAELSDVGQVQTTKTYRTKLTILNYDKQLADAVSAPTIAIYDAVRDAADSGTMTKLSTGIYEYIYAVPSNATNGLWETTASINLGGAAPITVQDYWEVEGAPAQVIINSISDTTLPSVAANITITNEGTAQYEYQYEYCVVSSEDNRCGGSDDTAYASAAKLIKAGESWTTELGLVISYPGNYWFKLVVYWGTESSGASRTFTAEQVNASDSRHVVSASVGVSDVYAKVLELQKNLLTSGKTQETYDDIQLIKSSLGVLPGQVTQPLYKQISDTSAQLNKTISLLNSKIDPSSSGLKSLLDISKTSVNNLKEMQNKLADLRAISASTQRIMEQSVNEPVVETWMTFNSVQFNFLISNPLSEARVLKFKSYLPAEVKPENILDAGGLNAEYDSNVNSYYIFGNISLGPKESVTRKVEIKDIWVFSSEEIDSLKKQAENLVVPLNKTQYEAQGAILKNEIGSTLDAILLNQSEGYRTPQDHIVAHRMNEAKMASVKADLDKMRDLVVQAGASQGMVGKVGGIQTFATWAIILAIVFGFGLLSIIIFAMWRHQTMMMTAALNMSKKEPQVAPPFVPSTK
ncbi:MAG: DUF2341 domain-containing protein [Parcubacteria group bacterium]